MSDTDQNPSTAAATPIQTGSLGLDNFAELMGELKTTVGRFQEDSTPQNFAQIVTALQGFGLSGADVWQQASTYARKNPLRVAACLGLAFYALKGLVAQAESTRKLIH